MSKKMFRKRIGEMCFESFGEHENCSRNDSTNDSVLPKRSHRCSSDGETKNDRDRPEADDENENDEINVVDVSDDEIRSVGPIERFGSEFFLTTPLNVSATKSRSLDFIRSGDDFDGRGDEFDGRSDEFDGRGDDFDGHGDEFDEIGTSAKNKRKPVSPHQQRPSVIRVNHGMRSDKLRFDSSDDFVTVDDHFRRSIPNFDERVAEAKVDAHFARALGEQTWSMIKSKQHAPGTPMADQRDDNDPET